MPPVAVEALENDPLVGFPFDKTEWPGADRISLRLGHAFFEGALWNHGKRLDVGEIGKKYRTRLFKMNPDGIAVRYFNLGYLRKPAQTRGGVFWIHGVVDAEFDVFRGHFSAVVKLHPLAQAKRIDPAIGRNLPRLSQIGLDVSLQVDSEKRIVH